MKKFINKILDVPKLIRTIWIILWLILIILLVFKFCFNLWYPVVSKNETFNNVCNYIDNNKWLYYLISYVLYIINFIIGYFICRGIKILFSNEKITICLATYAPNERLTKEILWAFFSNSLYI